MKSGDNKSLSVSYNEEEAVELVRMYANLSIVGNTLVNMSAPGNAETTLICIYNLQQWLEEAMFFTVDLARTQKVTWQKIGEAMGMAPSSARINANRKFMP